MSGQSFTEREYDIIGLLRACGPMSAFNISDDLGIPRRTTFDLVSRLMKKGVLHCVKEGGRVRYYTGRNAPRRCVDCITADMATLGTHQQNAIGDPAFE